MSQTSTPNQLKQTPSLITPLCKSYVQIAVSALPKVIIENAKMEVMGSNQRQKVTTWTKVELEKRWVMFRREALSTQKSEADLMLTLNKALQ